MHTLGNLCCLPGPQFLHLLNGVVKAPMPYSCCEDTDKDILPIGQCLPPNTGSIQVKQETAPAPHAAAEAFPKAKIELEKGQTFLLTSINQRVVRCPFHWVRNKGVTVVLLINSIFN